MRRDALLDGTEPRYWIVALGIMVLGMLARVWLFQQPANTDDIHYFQMASQYSFNSTDTHSMRFALLGLLKFWILLFGVSDWAFYASVYSIPVITFFALSWFFRCVSEPKAALIALGFWATSLVFIQTETRLLPDSFGTALALLGCAALLWSPPSHARIDWRSWASPLLGGFALWAACSVRESFIIVIPAALVVVLLRHSGAFRRKTLLLAVAGLALGGALELGLLTMLFADPLVRVRTLMAYPESAAGSSVFQLHSWSELLLRYPKMLYYTQSAEPFFFISGFAGIGLWLWRHHTMDKIKLVLWFFLFGFIAFAIVRVEPPTPLMRALIRYWVTALPLFYLATAELLLFLARAAPRMAPILALLLAIVPGLANLTVAAHDPKFAKNGHDGYFQAKHMAEKDQFETNLPKKLFTHRSTARVMPLLLTGWEILPITKKLDRWEAFQEGGYLLLDMKKFFSYLAAYSNAERVHPYLHLIERNPILSRHVYKNEILDLIRLVPHPIERGIDEQTTLLNGQWQQDKQMLTEPLMLAPKAQIASGGAPPFSPPLPGGWLVQLLFTAQIDPAATTRFGTATATLWSKRANQAAFVAQPFGQFYGDGIESEVALWSYLPETADHFRIVFDHYEGGAIRITRVRMRLLSRHPADRLEQKGGAW